jgi:cell division protein FtsN
MLIQAYEHKAKKAAVMTYASLGIGLVALLFAVIMGVIVFGMHSKIAKLSDLVSLLEEDMASIAGKNPDLAINTSDATIEQLKQKLNGQPERLEELTPPSLDRSENERAVDAKKQVNANTSFDSPQNKPPVLENKKPSEASVKKLSTEKKEPMEHAPLKQSLPSADGSKNKIIPVAEKPATAKKAKDKQQIRNPALENKKSSEATAKKLSAEKKAGKTQATAGWSVNLNAYENQNYAKNKAAKLSQKGIPVKVIPVDMNNAKWYRLKVGGFKSKEEATAYAAKIKKSLNLNSVSVVDK